MHIVGQIINIIPKWFHVFTQDHGAYKILILLYYMIVFVFLEKNTKDNHLSTDFSKFIVFQ
jgi:hypothetical protein